MRDNWLGWSPLLDDKTYILICFGIFIERQSASACVIRPSDQAHYQSFLLLCSPKFNFWLLGNIKQNSFGRELDVKSPYWNLIHRPLVRSDIYLSCKDNWPADLTSSAAQKSILFQKTNSSANTFWNVRILGVLFQCVDEIKLKELGGG